MLEIVKCIFISQKTNLVTGKTWETCPEYRINYGTRNNVLKTIDKE
jgi:hypothetical protein